MEGLVRNSFLYSFEKRATTNVLVV
jgi:hypothetical protein